MEILLAAQTRQATVRDHGRRALALVAALVLLASACGDDADDGPRANSSVVATAHAQGACSGSFVAVDLPHTTVGGGETLSTFDGTGTGLAAGDLDGDGDNDLVLVNLTGTTTIAENAGASGWLPHPLTEGRFRAAATVDVDGDDDLDVVLTNGIGPPVLFRNSNVGDLADRFEEETLPGVRAVTFAMAWSDLGADGDLDLVTGSYNAELVLLRSSPVLGADTGVVLHESGVDGYEVTRLFSEAQALAMTIADLDADGLLDIVVGNDLATPDMVFTTTDIGWRLQREIFPATSHSTHSYDSADLDGDGRPELFSTDNAPLPGTDPAAYREVRAASDAALRLDLIQTDENVLLELDDDGTWSNSARSLGVDATGWAWSGLFGDLDNDTEQDLFVVNGMRSEALFGSQPNNLLVEPNQAFRNQGDEMTPMPSWRLDDMAGGRGAVVVDLDRDGDLDIAVNNLDEPSRLFENQLCAGDGLTVELRWPDAPNNSRALGATVTLTDDGESQTRSVTSSRGYLSGTAPEVHFGVGDAEDVDLKVRWPDGAVSDLGEVDSGHHLVVTRDG